MKNGLNSYDSPTGGFVFNDGSPPVRLCGLRHCWEVATHHLTLIERLDLCQMHYEAMTDPGRTPRMGWDTWGKGFEAAS